MIKKSLISHLFVIPATAAVILFATFLWTPNYLITPPQLSGFEYQIETVIPVLLIAFFSFILPNKFEIELGLINGYSTLKLTVIKAIPIFVYTILTSFAAIAIYRYEPYTSTEFKSIFPIFVPDSFRIFTFISVFVNIMFFSSVFFFFRVLTRNCFIPVIADLLVFSSLTSISEGIRKGYTDIRVSLIDPLITTYFVGNTIPDSYAEKYKDLSLMKNAWTVNRLIFLFLSLAFLSATIMLLRREKLHRGMGE